MASRMSTPRVVVTDNGARQAWNAKAKAFGPWREATRYTEAAAEAAFDSIPSAVGIFAVSRPRKLPERSKLSA